MTNQILVADNNLPEVSIVMPCLNEADTLATCISKASRALAGHKIEGEIIVADNGSTDGSQAIAAKLNARLIQVSERGYGSALMAGIAAARGKFIIMGDADDSYDFAENTKVCRETAPRVRPRARPSLTFRRRNGKARSDAVVATVVG